LRKELTLAVFIVALWIGLASPAQSIPKQFAIHAGRLIDVRTGEVTKDAYILISGERIVSIGATAPVGVSIVDMSKFTIVQA
jgi:imidazolonepropionase-like amidohydrolase